MKRLQTAPFAGIIIAACCLAQAGATAIRPGFASTTFPSNDDGSVTNVALGFSINFYGVVTGTGNINNNGNVTFDSRLGTYTPFSLSTTNRQIIAPFFADVDTNGTAPVTYGSGSVGGNSAFGVNWIDVGWFTGDTPTNSFQLVIIDRSDIGVGDFDFEFNYDSILWETGNASGGSGGLGGNSARVGWSNGSTNTFELAGSAVNGAFLNGGPNALISNRLTSSVDGRYVFSVRNGEVQETVPDSGTTAVMMGLALVGLGAARRKTKN